MVRKEASDASDLASIHLHKKTKVFENALTKSIERCKMLTLGEGLDLVVHLANGWKQRKNNTPCNLDSAVLILQSGI
jgi:hypothetical protein